MHLKSIKYSSSWAILLIEDSIYTVRVLLKNDFLVLSEDLSMFVYQSIIRIIKGKEWKYILFPDPHIQLISIEERTTWFGLVSL